MTAKTRRISMKNIKLKFYHAIYFAVAWFTLMMLFAYLREGSDFLLVESAITHGIGAVVASLMWYVLMAYLNRGKKGNNE
jgi:accessory gene regulator protein AgrB